MSEWMINLIVTLALVPIGIGLAFLIQRLSHNSFFHSPSEVVLGGFVMAGVGALMYWANYGFARGGWF